jgi:type I restriction enzyme S subunit
MKMGWVVKKLIEICDIKPPKKESKERLDVQDIVSFVPMGDLGILIKDLIPSKERKLKDVYGGYTYFRENDVLLAKITPCFENGKLGIARNLKNGIGFGSSEYHVIRSKGDIIPDYLFYYLSRDQVRREGKNVMTGAVGHKRVPKDYIENIRIPYPKSQIEQERIIAIVDHAFNSINNVKNNVKKNLQNARELFESYLQNIFSNPCDDWKRIRIEDVCESIVDCVNKTAPILDEPTPFKMIRTTNVRNGRVNLDSVKCVSEENFKIWTRRQIPIRGDIILTREAPLGQVGMLQTDEQVFLGQRLVSYRADITKLDNKYLLYSFQSNDMQSQINAFASGSTVQHMRVPDSKKLLLHLPSLLEQQRISAKLDVLLTETKKLEAIYQKKLTNLEELKKSILQKAFNGEL